MQICKHCPSFLNGRIQRFVTSMRKTDSGQTWQIWMDVCATEYVLQLLNSYHSLFLTRDSRRWLVGTDQSAIWRWSERHLTVFCIDEIAPSYVVVQCTSQLFPIHRYLLQTFGMLFFQNTFLVLSIFKGRVDILIKMIEKKMSQGHNFLENQSIEKKANHF